MTDDGTDVERSFRPLDETSPWLYRARVERVVDGDTLDVEMDLGFGVHFSGDTARLRLRNVDTAEIYAVDRDSQTYATGVQQQGFVRDWCESARDNWDGDWPFLVRTYRDDERGAYGRYIADVVSRVDGAALQQAIIAMWPDVVDTTDD